MMFIKKYICLYICCDIIPQKKIKVANIIATITFLKSDYILRECN